MIGTNFFVLAQNYYLANSINSKVKTWGLPVNRCVDNWWETSFTKVMQHFFVLNPWKIKTEKGFLTRTAELTKIEQH